MRAFPTYFKETALLRAFGFFKIPMLFFVSPTVVELSDLRCIIRVPLNRRTKNHLNSMYFGALSVGADCAGGLLAMRFIRDQGNKVSLIFKDFHAEFLKRAEGDVFFSCEQGQELKELVQKTMESGERENLPLQVIATVPSQFGSEPIARFTLTLSLKKRKPAKKA